MLLEGSISVAQYAAWAVDALPPDEALRRRRGRQGVLRPRRRAPCARPRSRCTAESATRGSASCTCTCAGRCCRARCSATRATTCGRWPAVEWETTVDFGDSPEEAAFRAAHPRLAGRTTTRGCPRRRPTTSTGRGRPSGTARCSTRGFFALTWPKRIGGHELPPVYEVIVDEELAAAGAPPKPGLGYLIQGITRHGSDEICDRFLPALDQRARPLVPGLQRARRRLRPRVVAHARGARRRRVRHRRAQDLDQLLRRRRLVPAAGPHRSRRAEAQGHLRVRGADAPAGHRAASAEDDQRRSPASSARCCSTARACPPPT